MADPIRVHPRSQALHDHVHKIVLKILGHARDERYSNRRQQQQPRASNELRLCVLVIFGGVPVNDVTEDQRVEQRKYLVRGGQQKSNYHQLPVLLRIVKEKFHCETRPSLSTNLDGRHGVLIQELPHLFAECAARTHLGVQWGWPVNSPFSMQIWYATTSPRPSLSS